MENHTGPVTKFARGSAFDRSYRRTCVGIYIYMYICILHIVCYIYKYCRMDAMNGKERSTSLSPRGEYPLFGIPFSLSLFLCALDNSVSSSKLPSIVVVLLVHGLIESSEGSFATAPDPIVHSIIGAGNETQDYLLR